jgi:ribosomal protein S18 acetylase RimI-like enzyme
VSITIRKAQSSDLTVLRQFEQGVISAERPFDTTLKPDPINYYDLEFMLSASHIHLLVAEQDGELLGSGYARIEDAKHYLQHPQHAYLGFMYTVPAHRGKGINLAIITALKEWSKARGITEMRLDVYHRNEPAIRAYEKAGFVKHMIEMRSPTD